MPACLPFFLGRYSPTQGEDRQAQDKLRVSQAISSRKDAKDGMDGNELRPFSLIIIRSSCPRGFVDHSFSSSLVVNGSNTNQLIGRYTIGL